MDTTKHPGRMTISVALCTFNGERHLPAQLDSILQQERLPEEIVICDDCSTDKTLSILEIFKDTSPFRVTIIENARNLGPSANFEKAIQLCQCDAIVLCDQDDVWHTEKLRVLEETALDNPNCGGFFSDAEIVNDEGKVIAASLWATIGFDGLETKNQNELMRVLLRKNVVTGAAAMFRADSIRGAFPIPNHWLHDGWFAWLVAVQTGMIAISRPLISYRVHQNQHASIRSSSLYRRLASSASQRDGRTLLKRIGQLGTVSAKLQTLRTPTAQHWHGEIEEAITFLGFRLELSRMSFPHRVLSAVLRASDYQRYAEGAATMIRDIMIPHRPPFETHYSSENRSAS